MEIINEIQACRWGWGGVVDTLKLLVLQNIRAQIFFVRNLVLVGYVTYNISL